jgi:hypothetical protein
VLRSSPQSNTYLPQERERSRRVVVNKIKSIKIQQSRSYLCVYSVTWGTGSTDDYLLQVVSLPMLARGRMIKSVFLPFSATHARSLFIKTLTCGIPTDLLVPTCILRLNVRLPMFVWSPPESSISCFCRQLSAVVQPAPDAALISLCRQPSRGHCDCSWSSRI